MLSRDAEACYWIGRYVERAEATARMVDVHYHAALETSSPTENDGDDIRPLSWQSILAISGSDEAYHARYDTEHDRDILHFFAFDWENPCSILATWKMARENARTIREQIASEMWESLNISYRKLCEWNVERAMSGSPYEFFQLVKNSSHLFQGILNRTMMMGETRDWLDTGRFLERGDQTARLLDVKYHDLLPTAQPSEIDPLGVGGPLDTHGWIAVLKSVSAFEMYHKTYRTGIRPAHVVDCLVLNPQFPASVRHCVGRVESCLRRISGNQREEPQTEPERLIGRLRADLTYSRPEEIILGGLHEFLDNVQGRCNAIGNAITRTYLSY
jgi:uncharacterized alpha-E superfamily protein